MILNVNTDLSKVCSCCSPSYLNDGNFLTLEDSCFFQKNDTSKKLCLEDLAIPIPTDSYESCRLSGGLIKDQTRELRESFITLVKVDDYKELWWRFVKEELDELLTFCYKLKFATEESNMLSNPALVNLTIGFTQYDVNNSPTWNNVDELEIFGFPIGNWNSFGGVTWNQLSSKNLKNSKTLPSIEQEATVQIAMTSGVGYKQETLVFNFGNFKYTVVVDINLDLSNDVYTIDIVSAKVEGKYVSTSFYIGTLSNTLAMTSNEISGDLEISLLSQSIEEFNNLKSFLFLSSEVVMDKIKLLNQSTEKRNYHALQF